MAIVFVLLSVVKYFGTLEHQTVESAGSTDEDLPLVGWALALVHATHVASKALAVFENKVAFLANMELFGVFEVLIIRGSSIILD